MISSTIQKKVSILETFLSDIIEKTNKINTINKFKLHSERQYFLLSNKQTDSLVKDKYGIQLEKSKLKLSKSNDETCYSPEQKCF